MNLSRRHSVVRRRFARGGFAPQSLVGVIALIMTSLTSSGGDSMQTDVGHIFTAVPAVSRTQEVTAATYVRSRIVGVDWTGLVDLQQAGKGRLTLNLFDDTVLAAAVESVTVRADGYSLIGHVEAPPHGRFNLVVYKDALAGIVRGDEGLSYQIRRRSDGTHVVQQANATAYPTCGVNRETTQRFQNELLSRLEGQSSSSASGSISGMGQSNDDGSVLDILVLYSDVTRQAGGGTAAIRAEIQLAIDVANTAYLDSGIGTRLRLVHMDEVAYDELTGWDGFEDHVVRLRNPDDGYFDEAHDLRNLFGADLVSIIVEDSSSISLGSKTCGIAYVMQEMSSEFESRAMSAVNRECSAGNWTLVHEVGHNQGCAHNRENAGIDGLFSYSHGHRWFGSARGWRSIMAYNDSEDTWTRIGQFSNPSLNHDGAATGVPIGTAGEAHNASTIHSTRITVARFRTTRYWVDFNWTGAENGLFETPFVDLLDGLDAVPESGMVVVKSGEFNAPMLLEKPLKINSWSGSTIIGRAFP